MKILIFFSVFYSFSFTNKTRTRLKSINISISKVLCAVFVNSIYKSYLNRIQSQNSMRRQEILRIFIAHLHTRIHIHKQALFYAAGPAQIQSQIKFLQHDFSLVIRNMGMFLLGSYELLCV